ncbi:hypothetical protein [Thioclava kandeliae]|uniref:Tip attachment protein J domain-containing protein n=1 Tax=Thioclava kandeliae TaxID=3070818 RepID=A0ABV1SF95_9RHOB
MKKLLLATTALIAFSAAPAHADPITGAITAFYGLFGASAATAAALTQATVGLGLSLLSSVIAGQQTTKGVETKTEIELGDNTALTFTIGRYATGGKRKYVANKGSRRIVEVVELSALSQPGTLGLWVNDEEAEIDWASPANGGSWWKDGEGYGGTGAVYGYPVLNFREGSGTSARDRMLVKYIDGTQTAADARLVELFGDASEYPWTEEMIGAGKSYAILSYYYDPETMTSPPTNTFVMPALRLYDLRNDSTNGGYGDERWDDPTTWTGTGDENPAIQAYNIIRGIYYHGLNGSEPFKEWVWGGKNLDAWRLPADAWIAAANACDMPVTLSDGSTEPSFRTAAEITVDMVPADILEQIGQGANMRFAEVGGRIKPLVSVPVTAAQSITDESIVITEGRTDNPFPAMTDTFNALTATYPEPGEKWATKDAAEYPEEGSARQVELRAEDGGRYLPTSVSYPCVPYADQVQRLMRAQLEDYRRFRRPSFVMPPNALALEPLDAVSWSSARNGYEDKLFLGGAITITSSLNVQVSLTEADPSDYDWSSDFELPYVITPPVNLVKAAQGIDSFQAIPVVVQDNNGVDRRPAIQLSVQDDEITGLTALQMQLAVDGGSVSVDMSLPINDGLIWTYDNVLPATGYLVRGRLLSDLTPKSEWSEWVSVTTRAVYLSSADVTPELAEAMAQVQQAGEAIQQAKDDAAAAELAAQGVRDDLDALTVDLTGTIAENIAGVQQGIQAAKDEAAQSLSDAIATVEAGASGNIRSVVLDANLSDGTFNVVGVQPTWGANEVYPTGRTATYEVTETRNADCYLALNTTNGNWVGADDMDAYVMEVDFTLESGDLDGVMAQFIWNDGSAIDFRTYQLDTAYDELDIQGTSGRMQRLTVLGRRSGVSTVDVSQVTCRFWIGSETVSASPKLLKVHRFDIRIPTPEELGEGSVAQAFSKVYTKDEIDAAYAGRVDVLEASLIADNGALKDAYLDEGWGPWSTAANTGTTTSEPNKVHDFGKTWTLTSSATDRAGIALDSAYWLYDLCAEAYLVEVDLTVLSGDLSSCKLFIDWWQDVGSNKRTEAFLTEDLAFESAAVGVVQTVTLSLKRPDGVTREDFNGHKLYLISNWGPSTLDAACTYEVHRIHVRSASASELGRGPVETKINAAITSQDAIVLNREGALGQRIDSVETGYQDAVSAAKSEASATYLAKSDANSSSSQFRQALAAEYGAADTATAQAAASPLTVSGFEEKGLHWTNSLSGDPATKGGLLDAVTFGNTVYYGLVANVDGAFETSNVHIAPRNYVIGGRTRKFRTTVVARHQGEAVNNSASALRFQVRGIDRDFAATSLGSQVVSLTPTTNWSWSSPVTFEWETSTAYPYYLPFVFFDHNVMEAGVSYSVAYVLTEDITEAESVRAETAATLTNSYWLKSDGKAAVSAAETDLTAAYKAADTAVKSWANSQFYTTSQADSATAAQISSAEAVYLDGSNQIKASSLNAYTNTAGTKGLISAAKTELQGNIDDVSGDVTDIKGLKISALSGTALATLLTQLQTNSGGTSALLTTQGNAITDLEGNASAGYLIKAQAGSSVSLLDLVAADGSSGSVSVAKISASSIILDGTVQTKHIGANQVTADKIYVTSLSAITANLGTLSVGTLNVASQAITKSASTGIGVTAATSTWSEIMRLTFSGMATSFNIIGTFKAIMTDPASSFSSSSANAAIKVFVDGEQTDYLSWNYFSRMAQDDHHVIVNIAQNSVPSGTRTVVVQAINIAFNNAALNAIAVMR